MDANYGDYDDGVTPMTKQAEQALYRRSVRTLRRIPVDIRLDLATREFDMGDGSVCLIGTAVRAAIGKALDLPLEDVMQPWDVTGTAAEKFGGSEASWDEIFGGVCADNKLPIIERAFVNVLLETV